MSDDNNVAFNPDEPMDSEDNFDNAVRALIARERRSQRVVSETSVRDNLMPVYRHFQHMQRSAEDDMQRKTAELMLRRMDRFLSSVHHNTDIDQHNAVHDAMVKRKPPKPRRRRA